MNYTQMLLLLQTIRGLLWQSGNFFLRTSGYILKATNKALILEKRSDFFEIMYFF
jgi:hypothetical protein